MIVNGRPLIEKMINYDQSLSSIINLDQSLSPRCVFSVLRIGNTFAYGCVQFCAPQEDTKNQVECIPASDLQVAGPAGPAGHSHLRSCSNDITAEPNDLMMDRDLRS